MRLCPRVPVNENCVAPVSLKLRDTRDSCGSRGSPGSLVPLVLVVLLVLVLLLVLVVLLVLVPLVMTSGSSCFQARLRLSLTKAFFTRLFHPTWRHDR